MTGDTLTTLEYLTRGAQQGLRSPWFIIAFNGFTLAMMLVGWREQWNYIASWLAIMVEWIVGSFMFGQTKRDAVVMRKTEAMVEHIEDVVDVVDVVDVMDVGEGVVERGGER